MLMVLEQASGPNQVVHEREDLVVGLGGRPGRACPRPVTKVTTGESKPTRFECFWVPLDAAHIFQAELGAPLGRLVDRR